MRETSKMVAKRNISFLACFLFINNNVDYSNLKFWQFVDDKRSKSW